MFVYLRLAPHYSELDRDPETSWPYKLEICHGRLATEVQGSTKKGYLEISTRVKSDFILLRIIVKKNYVRSPVPHKGP